MSDSGDIITLVNKETGKPYLAKWTGKCQLFAVFDGDACIDILHPAIPRNNPKWDTIEFAEMSTQAYLVAVSENKLSPAEQQSVWDFELSENYNPYGK